MPFDPLRELAKLLMVIGVILVAVGVLLILGSKLPGRLGRLPGDIIIRRDNFTFYFPLVTCLLLSVVLSILFWLLGRLRP
jgi:formate hydrogenlyase subunit 3/multisubunit Na+/H+ antiporter MnhD subunit